MTEPATLISKLSNERWRSLLPPLFDSDQKVRSAAALSLQSALNERMTKDNPLWPNGPDALCLLEIAMTAEFPPTAETWKTPGHDILFWFVAKMKWPPLVAKVVEHFAAADDAVRLRALTILAAQHTEDAMRALGGLIELHGLPAKMYQRLWWELNASCAFADHLLPQLVLRAGRYLPQVVDFVNVARERGNLTPAKLTPALPLVEREVAERLPSVLARQRRGAGKRWLFEDEYVQVSHELGAYLDLLSLIPGGSTQAFEQAATSNDAYLLTVAITGLLRRGMEPPREVVRAAADSLLVRPGLYRVLESFGRLDLYPHELATFEAFAAAHMAEWLRYPSELGYEPERLELAATLHGTNDEGEWQWCLWRFEDDGVLYAGVSGPYALTPPAGPLEGSDVFSNFAEWGSATPEQHLESVLETLRDWRLNAARTY